MFFFSIWNHHECFSQLFPLRLNIYMLSVYGHYKYFTLLDFRRHNLTSMDMIDVGIWRLKSAPALKGVKIV